MAHLLVAWQENPAAAKQFLKTVGSNFMLKSRRLCVTYGSPFGLVAETDVRSDWLALSDELRTYFERSGLPESTKA